LSHVLYHHRWMDLCANNQDEAFIKMDDAVIVVPVLNDDVIMIEESSIAYGYKMLVFPMGGVEANESPTAAANRELQEEVGYKAGKVELIGLLHPSLKYAHWQYWLCLAHDLTPHRLDGDERSPVTSKVMKPQKLEDLIVEGVVTDSTVISAFYMARKHLSSK